MSGSRIRIKSSRASLIGGLAVGIACFVLWASIAHELGIDTVAWLFGGLVVSVAIAVWIKVADL